MGIPMLFFRWLIFRLAIQALKELRLRPANEQGKARNNVFAGKSPIFIFPIILLASACLAQTSDLTDLSIEELANVKVTSVSKKAESISQAPGAIFVLTGEAIQRGGFTTLPDALRTVPGLYVVQLNPHEWQISARGFGDLENNKMLVLVDGRSVYTPEYGGVYWDVLDVPLEDIDRVEVIRGPGGTLWGANSMNGVINIVMKPSAQTQGAMVSTSSDVNQGYTSTVQYAGRAGPDLTYRMFGKASYLEPYNSPSGLELPNNFNLSQAGLRVDWAASPKDNVTVEAGGYDGQFRGTELSSTVRATDLTEGSHILARWDHTVSDRSSIDVLTYCDWYTRTGVPAEIRNTCDIEFQHDYEYSERQSLIWGGSFLSTVDNLSQDPAPYSPEQRRNSVVSGFVQYGFVIVPDKFRVLAGIKLEHNDYTGFEHEPQVRAVWTPNSVHTFWTGVSRAIRTPSRNDSDLRLVLPLGTSNGAALFEDIFGNSNLTSEYLIAYEMGYRYQPTPAFSLDAALYYNDYSHLIIQGVPIPEALPNKIVLQSPFVNGPKAQTHGLELSAKWKPVGYCTLSAAVTETRGDVTAAAATPRHIFDVRSLVTLSPRLEFDSALYHYGALPLQAGPPGLGPQALPAFNRLDVGLSWRATSHWTLGLWGRNLQSRMHIESLPSSFDGLGTEVPRSVSFKVIWQQKAEAGRK
ncbi:MAG: TonB-dependent receptor plug domain-containing protein [Terriglobales bacterium]